MKEETDLMPEAVIVDAVRTPIGRAAKGSLKDVRTEWVNQMSWAAIGTK